mmetsp:Transcript_2721/g.3857  ORF Transcript_2721/g.3857 Transcript_2721/m.3857 type:complete len:457 (+) Transcript_2721:179-1549(+)
MSANTSKTGNGSEVGANSNKQNLNSNPAATEQQQPSQDQLRKMLRSCLTKVTRREPLEPTYKSFLLRGNARKKESFAIPKRSDIYKRIDHADLRHTVEDYMLHHGVETDPMRKCGKYRPNLDENAMRAAFTLRECKTFEQEPLIAATLAAAISRRLPGRNVDEGLRRISVEAMAVGMTEKERRRRNRDSANDKSLGKTGDNGVNAHQQTRNQILAAARQKILALDKKRKRAGEDETIHGSGSGVTKKNIDDHQNKRREKEQREAKEREIEERERLRTVELARQREREREIERQKEEEEARIKMEKEKEEMKRKARLAETPQQALHRLYEPVFRALWDMEFGNLNGTNPFRIVIDKENCVAMGIPDYCDIIKKPMNLTYIQEKVKKKSYRTLQEFIGDVNLTVQNALLYNSDRNNEFHVAAKQLERRFKKHIKKILQQVQQNKNPGTESTIDDDSNH